MTHHLVANDTGSSRILDSGSLASLCVKLETMPSTTIVISDAALRRIFAIDGNNLVPRSALH